MESVENHSQGLVVRYSVSLILVLFSLTTFKFFVDQCIPDYGYRIFSFRVGVPAAICSPLADWDSTIRANHELNKLNMAHSTADEPGAMEQVFVNEKSFTKAFGLSELPTILSSKLTKIWLAKLGFFLVVTPFVIVVLIDIFGALLNYKKM